MILSVDTGLNNYGLAVLDPETDKVKYVKVIQTKKSKVKGVKVSADYEARMRCILNQIKKVIGKYQVTKIYGEMPSFGFKSANAALSLGIGATLIVSISTLLGIPAVWCTPMDIKNEFEEGGSKEEIMEDVCNFYGWPITYKTVKFKKEGKPDRQDPIYHVMGEQLSKGYFEHIADAIAAYHICKEM